MPRLTRRRNPDAQQEAWYIHNGDVRVGTIGVRAGVPVDVDQWRWSCGFYPVSHRGQDADGTARSFKAARRDFMAAWRALLPTLTEADFDEWRRRRDFVDQMYAMRDRGEKMPTEFPSSLMPCVCGVTFDSHKPEESYQHRKHIYVAQATDGIRR
jgi:hypothetical protein